MSESTMEDYFKAVERDIAERKAAAQKARADKATDQQRRLALLTLERHKLEEGPDAPNQVEQAAIERVQLILRETVALIRADCLQKSLARTKQAAPGTP